NLTAASNSFGVTTAAPVELLERSWSNTFTSPQVNDIEVLMPTVSASVKATDTLTFSGVGYYRHLKNRVIDGNVTEAEECEDAPPVVGAPLPGGPGNEDFLCLDDDNPLLDRAGNAIRIDRVASDDDLVGSIERLATTSESWGGVFEGQEKAKL